MSRIVFCTTRHFRRVVSAVLSAGELRPNRRWDSGGGAGGNGLGIKAAGTVGRAHQRPAHHAEEADGASFVGELVELPRLDPALDRMVSRRRTEVLRDGDQVASGVVEVVESPTDLLARLAHAEDEVRLGDETRRAGRGEDLERPVVAERGPDPLEDARHGLDVVREDFRCGSEDLAEQVGVAGEVGSEQLDAGVGVECVDLSHGLGVEPRAFVLEIVTRDTGNGRVAQAHRAHRLGDPAGLVAVEWLGLAGVDLAEVTSPRAGVAADEERRLAVLPALEDVGATRFFADGVQAFARDQALECGVLRPGAQPRLDPRRLLLDRRRGVTHLEAKHAAAARVDCGHAGTAVANTRVSSRSTAGSTSVTAMVRPASCVSVVTPASVMPQGTMAANAERSQSQLSAKPCIVTPRATRTPIAATLRSGPRSSAGTHTPLRPSTCEVVTPNSAHTAMSASSSRRTCATTSTGSGSCTIG